MGYEDGSKDAVTPQEMFPDNIDLDKIGPRKSKPKLRKMPQFKGKEVKKRKVAEAAEGGGCEGQLGSRRGGDAGIGDMTTQSADAQPVVERAEYATMKSPVYLIAPASSPRS